LWGCRDAKTLLVGKKEGKKRYQGFTSTGKRGGSGRGRERSHGGHCEKSSKLQVGKRKQEGGPRKNGKK